MAAVFDIIRSFSSVLFWPLVLFVITLCLLIYLERQSRIYKMGNLLPGPPVLPLIGNAYLAIGKSPHEYALMALELGLKYGDVFRAFMGPRLLVALTHPQDVEVILESQEHIDKAVEYRFFKPWLGQGLLISTGKKWKTDRKMIAPTFHISILKSFMDAFNDNSINLVNKLKNEIGNTFDVHKYMSGVTVDILLETVMGLKKENRNESASLEYATAVLDMCDIIHQRHTKLWLLISDALYKLTPQHRKEQEALKIIHDFSERVIKKKRDDYVKNKGKGKYFLDSKEPKNEAKIKSTTGMNDTDVDKKYKDDIDVNDEDVGEKKRVAFLDHMIEAAHNSASNISDANIKEQVDTILFEGHDTTASASSFALCILGLHQDIQMKAYEELYGIFGDSNRPATFEDTVKMKYLERVILETLRMFAPVPIIARKLKHDVKIVTNNYVLPAGSTVVISPIGVNLNPKFYKNTEVFNPDNFLPENAQNRPFHSYIPFSAGPRSCVGRKYAMLKLKVVLSTIIRNYKIFSYVKEDNFIIQADIILKRADGFNISIKPRNQ